MAERKTSAERHAEAQFNKSFRADFPNASKAILDLHDWETTHIFNDIGRDQQVIQNLHKIRDFLSGKPEQHALSEFRIAVAAYFFEQFAFRFANLRLRVIGIIGKILSPEETFELLRVAFSDNKVCDAHMGLGQSHDGFKNPDGLLVSRQGRETVIRGVCEYTLQPIINPFGIGRKRRQLRVHESAKVVQSILQDSKRQIEIGQHLHSSNPDFPERLSGNLEGLLFVYVRPRIEHPSDQYSERMYRGNVHICASFKREQFYQVIDGLIKDTYR